VIFFWEKIKDLGSDTNMMGNQQDSLPRVSHQSTQATKF